MRIAFDDTDSLQGGCSTALVAPMVAASGAALRGMPRLVRLNPNVPHKTRGNAAVCFDLVRPEGPRVQVGQWQGQPVFAYPDGPPAAVEPTRLWRRLKELAEAEADPGLAALLESPSPVVYGEAVTGHVDDGALETLVRSIESLGDGSIYGGRGRIGALAAAAWPGPATSHELIAYRRADRIGTPRDVADLGDLDASGATFHSWDAAAGNQCVPNTPCPVLAGLRGLDPERLLQEGLPALQAASKEPVDGWMLFSTNQASGDHVVPVGRLDESPEWATVQVDATVLRDPKDHRGGRVVVGMADRMGQAFDAIAFEPTKEFRRTMRALRHGDEVAVVGSLRDGAIHVEKLRVDSVADVPTKAENPRCPQCLRSMKSKGTEAGYRCPDGHGSAPEEAAVWRLEDRKVRPGWYEVPVPARRHLHRPLVFGESPLSLDN